MAITTTIAHYNSIVIVVANGFGLAEITANADVIFVGIVSMVATDVMTVTVSIFGVARFVYVVLASDAVFGRQTAVLITF